MIAAFPSTSTRQINWESLISSAMKFCASFFSLIAFVVHMPSGGLSWQTNEATLRTHFEKFGELTDVALMVDKRTGTPRCVSIPLSSTFKITITHDSRLSPFSVLYRTIYLVKWFWLYQDEESAR